MSASESGWCIVIFCEYSHSPLAVWSQSHTTPVSVNARPTGNWLLAIHCCEQLANPSLVAHQITINSEQVKANLVLMKSCSKFDTDCISWSVVLYCSSSVRLAAVEMLCILITLINSYCFSIFWTPGSKDFYIYFHSFVFGDLLVQLFAALCPVDTLFFISLFSLLFVVFCVINKLDLTVGCG